jgi:hypothetical protein
MATLTATPAMVTVFVEPENLSRMMASLPCGALMQRDSDETQRE